ncbi:amidase [Spirochaetia bacterium]|nr:amidase [Spirochaetia bacterium]
MEIKKSFLPVNLYSRPGRKLNSVKGIVIHWVANPKTTADQNRNYFEGLKNQKTDDKRYAGAHFIIGLEGEIIQCIPEDEIGYHVGANSYKQEAVNRLSVYPNNCTIGIELCHLNWDGEFSALTLDAAKNLILDLCQRYSLGRGDIYRHFDITGKDCPRYFVQHENEWVKFLDFVFSQYH